MGKGDKYRPVDSKKWAQNWPLGPSRLERKAAEQLTQTAQDNGEYGKTAASEG